MIKSLFHLILLLLIKFLRAEDLKMADVPGEPTLLSLENSTKMADVPVKPTLLSVDNSPTMADVPGEPTLLSLENSTKMADVPVKPTLLTVDNSTKMADVPVKPTLLSVDNSPTMADVPGELTLLSLENSTKMADVPVKPTLLTVDNSTKMADVSGEPALLSVDNSTEIFPTEQPVVSKAIHQSGAKVDAAPFYAAIYFKDKRRCSGAIVHERYILTTTQCCNMADITNGLAHIHIGAIDTHTGLEITPSAYIYDEKYDNVTKTNDICIVQLPTKLKWSKSLQPLKLPQHPLPALAPAILYAWDNDNQAQHLKNIQLYMIEQTNCSQRFENNTKILGNNTTFCAGDVDMNQGACGIEYSAPLVANGSLYGLASWNLDCDETTSKRPLVFSDIYRMKKFITNIMEENLKE